MLNINIYKYEFIDYNRYNNMYYRDNNNFFKIKYILFMVLDIKPYNIYNDYYFFRFLDLIIVYEIVR